MLVMQPLCTSYSSVLREEIVVHLHLIEVALSLDVVTVVFVPHFEYFCLAVREGPMRFPCTLYVAQATGIGVQICHGVPERCALLLEAWNFLGTDWP